MTVDELTRTMDAAFEKLGRLHSSDPVSARNGAEARYGQAYIQLTKLGAKPSLKKKYRRVTG